MSRVRPPSPAPVSLNLCWTFLPRNANLIPGARYPSGKGEVCKTFMRRFDSDPRLHSFHPAFSTPKIKLVIPKRAAQRNPLSANATTTEGAPCLASVARRGIPPPRLSEHLKSSPPPTRERSAKPLCVGSIPTRVSQALADTFCVSR